MAYCNRCRRSFVYLRAKRQHIDDSPYHHVCYDCTDMPDFSQQEDFDNHREEVHHHCVPCDKSWPTAERLMRHDVVVHNLCVTCGRYFGSVNSLKNVGLTFVAWVEI